MIHSSQNTSYIIITLLICVLCTQATRWFPFLLFGGKRQLPELIRYLGTVLPPAIMAVLIVYCLKGVTPLTWPHGLPELIASAVTAGAYLWKKNTLISIFTGTLCYRILIQKIF